MKNTLLSAALLLGVSAASAQSYQGFLTDNYSGVHGLISNPANITDSRFKTDVNLAGVSTFFGNDYYGVSLSDITSGDFDFDIDGATTPTADNKIFGNADILGPAFMFNIKPNHSLALFTRARVNYNITEIDGRTFESVADGFDENESFFVEEGDFYMTAQGWSEIGLTYAAILMDRNEHFVKGGISLKYLQGLGNVYSSGSNVTIDYDPNGSTLPNGETVPSITSAGEVSYGKSDNIEEDFELEQVSGASGFGTDLGFVYEWRPDFASYTTTDEDGNTTVPKGQNKYKLKLGLSITDLGSVKYDDAEESSYDITNSVTEADFESEDGLEDKLNNLYRLTATNSSTKAVLPTALHLNADYNLAKRFYLNLNTDISMSSSSKANVGRIANTLALTPRFESKWFSFYMPLGTVQGSGFQWGAGLRAGPLYIGSGSILTTLMSDNVQAADIYAGLKIPIYQGKGRKLSGNTL